MVFTAHRAFLSFPTHHPVRIFALKTSSSDMSVVIDTPFNNLYLSAMLPETVSFSVQNEKAAAEVEVYVDSERVFNTTLYAYENTMFLQDIRSIIEDAIREKGNANGQCSLRISDENSSASTQTFLVLISDFVIPSPSFFLCTNFLTTRSSFRIHRNGKQMLSWLAMSSDAEHKYIDAVILPEGESTPTVLRWDEGQQQFSYGMLYAYLVDVQSVSEYFVQSYPQRKGKLLSFSVHVGPRSKTFYVTDEQPDFHLSFLNAFNVIEYADFYAVTTRKQKVERSEAHCNLDHIFYDQKTDMTFEVETSALPYEEAVWLNQLFSSRLVKVPVNENNEQQILITDSSSEITDSDKEQNRLKFTFKMAKDKQHRKSRRFASSNGLDFR